MTRSSQVFPSQLVDDLALVNDIVVEKGILDVFRQALLQPGVLIARLPI
nr:hypothetical protein [Candidatus Sigynarchaeota archaeon]